MSESARIIEETATKTGSWLGTRSCANRKTGQVGDAPARNDAIANSSNDSVKAIKNDEISAGSKSGSVTRRNVSQELAPRSWDASSKETLSRSRRGMIVRIM